MQSREPLEGKLRPGDRKPRSDAVCLLHSTISWCSSSRTRGVSEFRVAGEKIGRFQISGKRPKRIRENIFLELTSTSRRRATWKLGADYWLTQNLRSYGSERAVD